MNGEKPKPIPLLAVALTVGVFALAVQDQLSSGSIDSALLGAVVVLTLFWAGQGVDRLLK